MARVRQAQGRIRNVGTGSHTLTLDTSDSQPEEVEGIWISHGESGCGVLSSLSPS